MGCHIILSSGHFIYKELFIHIIRIFFKYYKFNYLSSFQLMFIKRQLCSYLKATYIRVSPFPIFNNFSHFLLIHNSWILMLSANEKCTKHIWVVHCHISINLSLISYLAFSHPYLNRSELLSGCKNWAYSARSQSVAETRRLTS